MRHIRALAIAALLALASGFLMFSSPIHAAGWPTGGVVIPAGATATFSQIEYGACNPLGWGYQLAGSPPLLQGFFPGGCVPGSDPDKTIGPFAQDTSVLVYLQDIQCGVLYYSDGTPVDHVIVSGSNPYTLRFADGGGFCERASTTTNTFSGFNFTVTLSISAKPANPVAAISVGTPNAGEFVTSSTPFQVTGSETMGSGISSVAYRVCPGSCDPADPSGYSSSPGSTSPPFTISGLDGPYEVDGTASDGTTMSPIASLHVTLDNTAPTTTASAGAYSFGTWTNQSVTVSLSAADGVGGSGVQATYYGLDSANCATNAAASCSTYTTPISLSAEGQHTLTYFSVDNVGNVESSHSASIWIDKTAPSLNINGPADGTIFSVCAPAPASPTFAPTDALSGVNSATVGSSWASVLQPSGVGSYTYSARASDNAGNASSQTLHYAVQYGSAFGGFLTHTPPQGYYNLGAAINVKFQLLCGSNPINNAVVRLYAQPGSVSSPTNGTAGIPFSFVYSSTLNSYQYVDTISTGKPFTNPDGTVVNFTAGNWTLTAMLDDGTTRTLTISLQ